MLAPPIEIEVSECLAIRRRVRERGTGLTFQRDFPVPTGPHFKTVGARAVPRHLFGFQAVSLCKQQPMAFARRSAACDPP